MVDLITAFLAKQTNETKKTRNKTNFYLTIVNRDLQIVHVIVCSVIWFVVSAVFAHSPADYYYYFVVVHGNG